MINVLPQNLVSEAVLIRGGFDGAIVFTEAASDARLFERILVETRVIGAHGKQPVLDTVAICENLGLDGVLGIVDRDYDPPQRAQGNIIHTTASDMEMMLVKSSAFDALIEELSSRPKLTRACNAEGVKDARELLASRCARIGALRQLNAEERLGLTFKSRLNYKRAIDLSTLEVDMDRIIASVCNEGDDPQWLRARAGDLYNSVAHSPSALLDICNGHDYLQFLSRGLKRLIGNQQDISVELLAAAMRAAFGREHLREVSLARALQAWHESTGFRLLP